MPTRYTFQQVVAIFESNKCVLLDTKYTNQLQELNYIAICGHTNSTPLKTFLRGDCLKCRACALNIHTFKTISKAFSDKGCALSITEEEFNTNTFGNNKRKINYIALCGHSNSVALNNFISLNQGIKCPSCVNKNTGEKLKQLRSGENKNSSIEQEFKCIQYFIGFINEYFQVKKTFNGCRTDIVLRPVDSIVDLWLGIQVKSTCKKTDKGKYYFRLNGINYDNYLILCICLEDKNMWLIPYEDVKGHKTIGISIKSNMFHISLTNVNCCKLLY